MIMDSLFVIGRAENIKLPTLGVDKVPAKIDTGADASSIWCSSARLVDDKLECVFFGKGNSFYTGKAHVFTKKEFTITRVANSFGHREVRFKIKISIKVRGRLINATFTLADRSQKLYPILIGRSTLRGKFMVDVRKGTPMKAQEKKRRKKLIKELYPLRKELFR